MRRPLFGNGVPKRALVDDGVITLFDTNDFTPQEKAPAAFAVTLFVWGWQTTAPFATPANLPDIGTFVTSDGAGPIALSQRLHADFAAYELANESTTAKPIKLLDRYVVRGDQKVTCANVNANCSVANGMNCWIYGYFEPVGVTVPSVPFRGLMPSLATTEPFSFPPTVVDVPAATTQFKIAHLLPNNNYIDDLVLNVNVAFPEDGTGAAAWLRLPGNVRLPLPLNNLGLNPHELFLSEVFDGIPMFAPNANAGNNLVEVGFDTSGNRASVLAAYGAFRRR